MTKLIIIRRHRKHNNNKQQKEQQYHCGDHTETVEVYAGAKWQDSMRDIRLRLRQSQFQFKILFCPIHKYRQDMCKDYGFPPGRVVN